MKLVIIMACTSRPFFVFLQVLAQAATSTTETIQPNALAGFAAQAVTYVLGLGLFPMYLDGKQWTPPLVRV